jgi:hypothetical protein
VQTTAKINGIPGGCGLVWINKTFTLVKIDALRITP